MVFRCSIIGDIYTPTDIHHQGTKREKKWRKIHQGLVELIQPTHIFFFHLLSLASCLASSTLSQLYLTGALISMITTLINAIGFGCHNLNPLILIIIKALVERLNLNRIKYLPCSIVGPIHFQQSRVFFNFVSFENIRQLPQYLSHQKW